MSILHSLVYCLLYSSRKYIYRIIAVKIILLKLFLSTVRLDMYFCLYPIEEKFVSPAHSRRTLISGGNFLIIASMFLIGDLVKYDSYSP